MPCAVRGAAQGTGESLHAHEAGAAQPGDRLGLPAEAFSFSPQDTNFSGSHANAAAAGPHNPGFLAVIFAGFPRVCALSIRTSAREGGGLRPRD